ncbi:restriction endonuclease subunit S [Rhizobium bangladeshense]|uniref:restriction endonuclease subunit S n=1 Tax=Rhizobium bangladeshense TaxID=1138189 RepID=UPI001C83D4D9|nr:restriction endonuclease subunit S [Rhizobium bangladeshense]MBX4916721.1 restriction endonuclease subunit S [Rhizobium bangladeshense]
MTESYPRLRLKYAVELRRSRTEGSESELPYIGLENIESGTGKLITTTNAQETDDPSVVVVGESLSSVFQAGDILFGKLRPYLAKAWIAAFNGRCSTELLPLRPEKLNPRFGLYVMLSREFIDAVDGSTFGSKMPRADWAFIGNVPIPFPHRSTQERIADFLDRETSDIDALITAKQRLLELMAEKRRAIVAEAVMRGLDPSAPLRSSDVNWLGDIPAHWEVRRVATLFSQRDERNQPDLPLLEVSINAGVIVREFSTDKIEGTAADFNTYKVARRGDIAFNKMRMWQGAVGVAPVDGLVSPDYTVATAKAELLPEFAGQLFRTESFSAECGRYSQGITWDRLRLYWDGFRDIFISVPPLDEQQQIVEYISAETTKIDRLRAATENSIALLKERRAALVTAAVTGQIEIPEAA